MITIYDKFEAAFIIRPCPLINITWNSVFNEDGPLGGKYDIVLTGSLLDNNGSPIFIWNNRNSPSPTGTSLGIGWTPQYYPIPNDSNSKPPQQNFSELGALHSILSKQIALRELFSKHCARVEVASVFPGETTEIFKFYPKLISINFSEGIWVHKCDYTITLEAEFLLDREDNIVGVESYATKTFKPGTPNWPTNNKIKIQDFLDRAGGFIEDFQESWSIEPEDGNGNTVDPSTNSENITRVYRLTRNISAKGKNILGYECFGTDSNREKYRAHEQARRYVINHIQNSGNTGNHYDDYPSAANGPLNYFASGLLNISANTHGGFNHSRTENIDINQGTYSVQDTWILSSGNSYENYSLSLSSNSEDPRHRVSIEGTIKGLTSIPASGMIFGGDHASNLNTAYENAINKYRQITNSGQFGLNAHVYRRAQNALGGFTLNEVPLSVSLATNEFTGEINYTIEYDDRPRSLVSGSLYENITVSDTYPGDVFAVIPVIGRMTGPVLQYLGTRTEYQRQLSIELVVDAASQPARTGGALVPSNQNAPTLKPSIGPQRQSIINAINFYSPAREPGIRKFFVNPPQETWEPKEGRYTLSITWVYELNY